MSDDYVLGTNDEELRRLGMQHGVWRAEARAAWERAGLSSQDTLVDLGCGPGYATADLAAIVGRVIAIDKSARYLDEVRRRGLANVEVRACDFDAEPLPVEGADAVWARWVFAFLARPRDLVAKLAQAVRPGGTFVCHEYFDYRTWRVTPRVPEIEEFVAGVMASWRSQGGEPDIALDLLRWLPELGFEITSTRTIVNVAAPGDPMWTWVATFGQTGLARLVELGIVPPERAPDIARAWRDVASVPGVRMVTPGVLEIVAKRT